MLIHEVVELRNAGRPSGLLGRGSTTLRAMTGDKIERKEAIGQVTTAIITGATGIATEFIPGLKDNPALQTFIAVYTPMLGLAASTAIDRAIKRRTAYFSEGFVNALGDEAGKRLEELADDEDNQDLMLDAFRKLMNAVSVDVAPTLGYLAGQYTGAKRRADTHFRALGRLLCDLEPGDLGQLKRMMRLPKEDRSMNTTGVFDIEVNWKSFTDDPPIIYVDGEEVSGIESGQRIMKLLKREGFAFTATPDKHAFIDDKVTMAYDDLAKIVSTIDPEFASSNGYRLIWKD